MSEPKLSLRVIRYKRAEPAAPMQMTFDASGGTIGRGQDNDWRLPDPQRFVSGTHARVDFTGGHFELTDISANGVFVNGSRKPVGRDNTITLADQDKLAFGEYDVVVELRAAVTASALPETALASAQAMLLPSNEAPIDASAEFGDWSLDEPGASSDQAARRRLPDTFSEALEGRAHEAWPDEDTTGIIGGTGATGIGVGSATAAVHSAGSESSATQVDAELFAQAEPAHQSRQHGEPPATHGADAGAMSDATATLLVALGIDKQLPHSSATPVELLQAIGSLLREMTAGLSELLQLRRELKDHVRADRPMPWRNSNPLDSTALDPMEMVAALLEQRDQAARMVRTTISDLRAHERASAAGTQSALRALISEFDPANLEQDSDTTLFERMTPPLRKAALWERYLERHQRDAGDVDALVLQLMRGAFARAYDEQERALSPVQPSPGDPSEPL